MDTVLVRTFLEIVGRGSFAAAATGLHVTQTAVSARVKVLEDQLGRQLFVRNKAGAALTAAGARFLPYATRLLQVWERARAQVAVPAGRSDTVQLGCEYSLWDPLMVDWMLWMRKGAPELAVRVEVGAPIELLERVAHGTLDVAILYAPQQRPGLRIELLVEEKLVLVTTDPQAKAARAADYVYVDWGQEFSQQHGLAFPELSGVGVSAGLGPLAREYLLAAGGSGYFRRGVVRAHLKTGQLHRVRGAPEFLYPAYAVYAQQADMNLLAPALEGLRRAARVRIRTSAEPAALRKPRR